MITPWCNILNLWSIPYVEIENDILISTSQFSFGDGGAIARAPWREQPMSQIAMWSDFGAIARAPWREQPILPKQLWNQDFTNIPNFIIWNFHFVRSVHTSRAPLTLSTCQKKNSKKIFGGFPPHPPKNCFGVVYHCYLICQSRHALKFHSTMYHGARWHRWLEFVASVSFP